MIYVLILTVYALHGSAASAPNPVTAEFNTLADCQNAGKSFSQATKSAIPYEGMVTVYSCSQKGTTPP